MFQLFEVNTVAMGRRGHFWVGRAALFVSQSLNNSVPTPSFGAYFTGMNLLEVLLKGIYPG